jgi:YesN/AraC family two-component response regulator
MKRPRILIVEDELLIAKNISIILENEGYETVYGITNFEDAVAVFLQEKFDLVLIDIKLRGNSDGVDLGTLLLKKNTIPFIYITSISDTVTINRVKQTRPHGTIIKPFKAIDIKTSVDIVINNFCYKKIDSIRHEEEVIESEVPFLLKNVINYINENIHNKITLEELAALTKWSTQHLIKLFTKFVNQTPYQYILSKKIEKAKVIIQSENPLLRNVAYDLSFKSYSNFCIAFKKETGKTPEQYKKEQNIKKHLD